MKTKEELKELKDEYDRVSQNIRELSEEELASVVGGVYDDNTYAYQDGPEYDAQFKFKVGQTVEFIVCDLIFHVFTDQCTIRHRSHNSSGNPVYQCSGIVDVANFIWLREDQFE